MENGGLGSLIHTARVTGPLLGVWWSPRQGSAFMMRPREALGEEFKVTLLLRVDPAPAQPPARPKVTPPQILRQQPSLVTLVPAQVRDQTLHFCCGGHGCSIPGRGTQVLQAPDPTRQKKIRESLDNLADTQSSQERRFRHTVPEE